MFYIAGVDEAGRGPVLGPMVMSILAAREVDLQTFKKIGVKDSKLLSASKREELAKYIQATSPHITIKISPKEIDEALLSDSSSLNELEAKTTAKLISRLAKLVDCKEVMVDLPSKNKEAYLHSIQNGLAKSLRGITIRAEFKADLNYLQVGAASILAKVARDKSIKLAEKKMGFSIGSGYPADPYTIKSLSEHFDELKDSGLVRHEWKTIKNLLAKKNQSTLGDF